MLERQVRRIAAFGVGMKSRFGGPTDQFTSGRAHVIADCDGPHFDITFCLVVGMASSRTSNDHSSTNLCSTDMLLFNVEVNLCRGAVLNYLLTIECHL
jgi:hypothetical protein